MLADSALTTATKYNFKTFNLLILYIFKTVDLVHVGSNINKCCRCLLLVHVNSCS